MSLYLFLAKLFTCHRVVPKELNTVAHTVRINWLLSDVRGPQGYLITLSPNNISTTRIYIVVVL